VTFFLFADLKLFTLELNFTIPVSGVDEKPKDIVIGSFKFLRFGHCF